MLQSVRLTVGRTWRLVTGVGDVTVAEDRTGYQDQLNLLKSGSAPDAFKLAWPDYKSTLWTHWFHGPYRSVPTQTLTAGLLPTRYEGYTFGHRFEVLRHPFAVTTIARFDLGRAAEPWPPDAEAPRVLRDFLKRPLPGPGGQIRDGIPLELVPDLPSRDFEGNAVTYEEVSQFNLLSGLHQEAEEPGELAYRLAALFEDSATTRSQPMKTESTAIAVTGGRAAFVIPRGQSDAGTRVSCLHQNMSTVLGMVQNLASIMGGTATVPAIWFQTRSAVVLNHLYRRADLVETNGIYKSRLVELWINYRGLTDSINQIAMSAASPPPLLPAPDPNGPA